jgi:hydroxymethylglutaryl-CoA lyase
MKGFPIVLHTEEIMRDGLQCSSESIPVSEKIRLLNALSETGLKEIAVGSFVSPKWTPQMACIEELVAGFTPKLGVRYTYSALNEKGLQRAKNYVPPLSPRIREYSTKYSMCEVFAIRNSNKTQAKEVLNWPKQIAKAKADGIANGGISLSCAWGSNWTGEFTQEQRMLAIDRMYTMWAEAGISVQRINLADPMSWAMPHQLERQLVAIKERWPSITDFNLHLHNGRGLALASAYSALRVLGSGDTLRIQSSLGGLAGCPYCGNGQAAMMIATEDLIHLLEEMGISTGVDIEALIKCVWLAEEILGHKLFGFVSKAGPRPRFGRLYPMDMPRIETVEQAKHFINGPKAYAGMPSPWSEPIRSYQRPESLIDDCSATKAGFEDKSSNGRP